MIRDDKKTYVIKDSRSDYYKIGNSVDLYGREKALYHEVPSIEILFTFDYMIELHLHYYFKTKRLRGEWFALDSSDIELLSSLQDLPSQEVVEKLPCWDLLITEDVRRIFKLELKKIGEGKKYLAEKMGISTSSLNFYWRLSKTIREDVLLRILEIIDTRIEIKDFEGGSIILNEGGLNVHKIELSNLAPVGLIGNNTPPYIETEQITPNQLTFYTGRNLFPSDMFCPCQMCNDFFENGLFIRSIDDAKRYAKIAKGKGIVFFINKKQRTGWTTSRDLFKVA